MLRNVNRKQEVALMQGMILCDTFLKLKHLINVAARAIPAVDDTFVKSLLA